jgi:hypothetical protein
MAFGLFAKTFVESFLVVNHHQCRKREGMVTLRKIFAAKAGVKGWTVMDR